MLSNGNRQLGSSCRTRVVTTYQCCRRVQLVQNVLKVIGLTQELGAFKWAPQQSHRNVIIRNRRASPRICIILSSNPVGVQGNGDQRNFGPKLSKQNINWDGSIQNFRTELKRLFFSTCKSRITAIKVKLDSKKYIRSRHLLLFKETN